MSKAILDADVIAYMASVGAEAHDGVFGEDDAATHLEAATQRADEMVVGWMEAAECTASKLAFSGSSADNFRRSVHPQYKHNRSGEKPEDYYEVVQYLKDNYLTASVDELEGDDILGMHMGNDWIAVSTDKDMRTVPGQFVHIRYDGSIDRYNTTLEMGNHFWMWQTLQGDTVDGYKGCPGCGRKGATSTLPYVGATLSRLWDSVVGRYEEAWRKPKMKAKFITGHPYDEALMNARVARILRDGDYTDTGVKLWNP